MKGMRGAFLAIGIILVVASPIQAQGAGPVYSIEGAVAVAEAQNPEIVVARKKVQAARGGVVEARSGYLPSVVSTGLFREYQHQRESRLRDEDYGASLRIIQNLYTGGAVPNQLAIARLNLEIQQLELQAIASRVAMDVRIAFNELLLNRARINVYEQSVGVLQEEVRSQQQRFSAGISGQLNVRRAEVALANEQPNLVDAQTRLKSSYIRVGELLGIESRSSSKAAPFEATGQLQYRGGQPTLSDCLARADRERPEIKARLKQVEIEERQAEVDRSAMRPQLEAFSGYEVYNERDPLVGPEFNHGYVVGLNARWNIFDGFATKGRVLATQARRDAAVQTLKATRLSVASEVRNAFLDSQQADRVLESETKNIQLAEESLSIAKANLVAGLGTQLDILQAASDVTRTRTTRLNAIYEHNAALARLAHACGVTPEVLVSADQMTGNAAEEKSIADLTQPPQKLTQR